MTYEKLGKVERRLAALELAQERYEYNPITGQLFDNKTGLLMDQLNSGPNVLLNTKLGAVTAQQFVWYVMTGLDPNEDGAQIVHIDNETTNNAHWNLERRMRVIKDRAPNKNNTTSPYSGVCMSKKTGRYSAYYIDVDGKQRTVPGSFETAHAAKVARDDVIGEILREMSERGFKTRIERNGEAN